eukprot:TRINITY_DN2529_c0_g1_i4.p1 TRINITY_DN2529_c0_g1~~TRINITY_DN2529_c0_g1_i4.p1  ORF type:complete len:254 (+),score=32.11 TRINITY_DN2529_c0_g1_i4:283-1044(+)
MSNLLGCFLMGVLTQFKSDSFFVVNPDIYNGLSVGLLGSFTTFSSWMGAAGLSLWEYEGGNFFMIILVGLCTSFCGHIAGIAFVKLLSGGTSPRPEFLGSSNVQSRAWVVCLFIIVPWSVILAVIFGASFPTHHLYAFLCGPVGAIIRHKLGILNSSFDPNFPLWTFMPNIIGSVIWFGTNIVLLAVEQDTRLIVQSAIMVGFCGCFTTVSSLIQQIYSLNIPSALKYLLASILVTQILLAVVGAVAYETHIL